MAPCRRGKVEIKTGRSWSSELMLNREQILDRMADQWWIFALQGVAAIVFGVLALVWPGITLLWLVILFAAYALVHGVLALTSGLRRGADGKPDWWRIVGGVVSIAAGVVAFAMPGITAYVLLVLIAAWAIVSGAIELVAAYQLRDVIRGEWLLALNGVVAIIFGILLIAFPSAGALAVVWLIGSFAIASGVILLALAMRLRGRARRAGTAAA
jgi:uncharacterized membrane protein HdeD (DUF308 family)